MTRWIVLHSTLGVTLPRNVGYKSIGHGFYLEDGTETDNKFYSNIGIFARAAVENAQNPRKIPGILAANGRPRVQGSNVENPGFPYRSDGEYPSVFWITNGWNDFVGNMAAGAGTCGAAYWFVPAENMRHGRGAAGSTPMRWSGYAAMQGTGLAGTTPLKSFYKNYATSAMHSFQTTGDAPACNGVIAADATRQPKIAGHEGGREHCPAGPARIDPEIRAPDNLTILLSALWRNAPRSSVDVDKGYDCSKRPAAPMTWARSEPAAR